MLTEAKRTMQKFLINEILYEKDKKINYSMGENIIFSYHNLAKDLYLEYINCSKINRKKTTKLENV